MEKPFCPSNLIHYKICLLFFHSIEGKFGEESFANVKTIRSIFFLMVRGKEKQTKIVLKVARGSST